MNRLVRAGEQVGAGVVADTQRPVLILGLAPRSGTNYLWDLLCLHPDCAPGREPIREDFFLEHADRLLDFVRTVRSRWDPAWGQVGVDTVADLHAALGAGLLSFLTVDPARRLVVKTPSVVNLEHAHTLFPTAQVLVLARDGRAVVESCVRTFGWDFDLAARRWADAARTAREFFTDRSPTDPGARLVRYEDLVTDLRPALAALLDFLGLDRDRYDFGAAEHLPVRGSSDTAHTGAVHWQPVAREEAFDPLRRWQHWAPHDHQRFAWLAGTEQAALGYDLAVPVPAGGASRALHLLGDGRWRLRRGLKLAKYRLRNRLGPPTRPLRERLGIARER